MSKEDFLPFRLAGVQPRCAHCHSWIHDVKWAGFDEEGKGVGNCSTSGMECWLTKYACEKFRINLEMPVHTDKYTDLRDALLVWRGQQ